MSLIINYKIPVYDESNKIIKFELKYIYEIEINNIKEKKGGDIFDEINLDDIIIKKEEKSVEKNVENINKKQNIEIFKLDTNLIKKHNIKIISEKSTDVIHYKIKNITFNNYNSIYDIKLLIFYLIGVPIENQNLYNIKQPSLVYEYNNRITNEQIDININNITNLINVKYYNYIPIDFDLVNNRINYIIESHEKNKYISQININKKIEFDLICLNDFINKYGKNNLYKELNKDDELLTIIYKGFVEKYYPYYTIDLFLLYLSNSNKNIEYSELNILKDKIIKKNDKIKDIFSKNKSNMQIDLNYKKLIYHIPSYNNTKKINLKELFNNIELSKYENIKKIELQLEIDNKTIYFSKNSILSYNNKLNDEIDNKLNNLYINNKNHNSLLDSVYLKNNILFIIYSIKEKDIIFDIYILIDDLFDIYIIYNVSDYLVSANKNKSINVYKDYVINYINKLLVQLYNNKIINEKIVVNENKIDLLLIDSQIIINEHINNFNKLYLELSNLEILDFYKLINYDEVNNIIELNNYKIKYNLSNENKQYLNDLTQNYYNFYIKNDLIEKYKKLLYFSKIIITNRIKDLRIDILNIKKDELEDIITLLKYIIYNQIINNKDNKKDTKNILKIKNKLKKLKEIDPLLYAINKKNTQNLYSRKCQASQQPDIVDIKDLKKIKNYTKYINFTTGEPIYYTCSNKKFPTVKFLTNLHPKNYCIPCCKKKAIEDVKVKSKYTAIHNECLTNYKYDKKNLLTDEKSRYIMNYSPKIIIENLRLMQIPDELTKLFNKVYESDESTSVNESKYYIYGINQDVNNISNVGIYNVMSFVLNKSSEETLTIIKKLFINNVNLFNTIMNGLLVYYFHSLKEFLVILTNIFQDKILINDLNFNFSKWNELFSEILKYLGYIIITFEEIIYDTNNYDIELKIPENIKNINEYIYNNENFNYIILIKRKYKNKYLYYPLVKANYYEYYSKNLFINQTYSFNSKIIRLIGEIIKVKLEPINNSLNLEFIEKFLLENKKYTIEYYYINNKSEIYSILIKNKNNKYVYLNINKQKIFNDALYNYNKSNKKYKNEYINLKLYNINLNDILLFIKDFNNYIYVQNKKYYSELDYKYYINTIDKKNIIIPNINNNLNQHTKDTFAYLYINSFIIYKDNIIGLIIGVNINNINKNYNLYISKELSKSIGENIVKSKRNEILKIFNKKNISKEDIKIILTRQFLNFNNTIVNYIYNPTEINKIIYKNKYIPDNRIIKRNEALYHTNLYNLLLIHFSNKLYKTKNMIIRSKIKNEISNLTKENIKSILSNEYNKIDNIIKKYILNDELTLKILNNFNNFIKNQIIKIANNLSIFKLPELKKKIISNFDDTLFLFDNITIYNIIKLDKDKAIKELDKIFQNEIIYSNLNNKEEITLELCENIKSSYNCKNNKLIISKKLYYQFLDIWYYDLINPFKQKLILNLVNYNLNNIYQFKQFNNEKIYIYL